MKNIYQKILTGYFVFLVVYWVFLWRSGHQASNFNYLFSLLFSLVPLFGGLIGMINAKIWGGLKSSLGRAVLFFAAGLFFWGIGSMVWAYYNFIPKVAAPYPSIADIGYILAPIFWAVGAFNLSKASGAKYGWKNPVAKAVAILLPLAILGISYHLLVNVARGGVLTAEGVGLLQLVLDIGYPMSDVIILTLALLIFGLSFKLMGGYYKNSMIALLAGLGMMYFADFTFSYTITTETFYVGQFGDLLFATSLSLMTFGTLGFATKPNSATSKSNLQSPGDEELKVGEGVDGAK